jgi:hypothetical protein
MYTSLTNIQGGSKPAPNYTLVVTLASLLVAAALAYFPWSTIDRGFVKLRSFFLRPRTTVIFTCFMTLSWFAAMISMTVHSTDSSNCTLNQNILKNDTSYATAWVDQVKYNNNEENKTERPILAFS